MKSEKKNRKVIISGGGTGGHVFPAIAIADALKEKDPTIEIRFVGAQGKIEMEKVPAAGYPIDGLWISGIQRKLTLKNLLFPFKLISSMWKAQKIIGRFRPDVAVGVGGYASYPTLAVAARRGIPTLIQEQNSYAGVTNKMLQNKVRTVCVAYDKMERYFPKANIIWTGNPVRKDIAELEKKKAEALAHFGFKPDRKTIVIMGGSLGARTLNDSMGSNTALLTKHPEVQVLWQAGKLYIEEFKDSDTARLENVKVQAFIKRMDLAYAMADVVIGRAGALTISELCLVAKPAILVPSPNVAEDHQTKNAMALVEKDAAILVKDKDARDMVQNAIELLADSDKMALLSKNIKRLAKPNAAAQIADEVMKLIDNQG